MKEKPEKAFETSKLCDYLVRHRTRRRIVYLIPKKVDNVLPSPEELVPGCTCKKCAFKTCNCRTLSLACCDSCACKVMEICKNPFKSE